MENGVLPKTVHAGIAQDTSSFPSIIQVAFSHIFVFLPCAIWLVYWTALKGMET